MSQVFSAAEKFVKHGNVSRYQLGISYICQSKKKADVIKIPQKLSGERHVAKVSIFVSLFGVLPGVTVLKELFQSVEYLNSKLQQSSTKDVINFALSTSMVSVQPLKHGCTALSVESGHTCCTPCCISVRAVLTHNKCHCLWAGHWIFRYDKTSACIFWAGKNALHRCGGNCC